MKIGTTFEYKNDVAHYLGKYKKQNYFYAHIEDKVFVSKEKLPVPIGSSEVAKITLKDVFQICLKRGNILPWVVRHTCLSVQRT